MGSALNQPEVSVVIPTRDRWHILESAALRAALLQTDVDHEIIIVDDGSVDETALRLEGLAQPRVRVIRHERSLGVAQARNAGIYAARGAWIAFLDDDDIWAPDKLRRQIDAATESGRAWVYAASAALDEERRFLFSLEPPEAEHLTRSLLRWNELWGGCSNVVVRADVARDLGGFDESLFQLADWDLWIRLALKESPAGVRDVLLGCVMHSRSMLATDERNVFLEFDYLAGKHREASRAFGIDFDAARFNRWVAFGHRAAGRRVPAARTYVRGAMKHRDVGALPRTLAALLGEKSFAAWRGLAPDSAKYLPVDPETLTWLAQYSSPD